VVERAWLDAERRGKNGRNEEKIVVALLGGLATAYLGSHLVVFPPGPG
jgi:hypothetical protein